MSIRTLHCVGIVLAIAVSAEGVLLSISEQSAQAVQTSDGTVYFNHPPTLDNAFATIRRTTASGGIYYFTLTLPEDAGEPLQRITVQQLEGGTSFRLIRYKVKETQAFTGTHRRPGEALTVGQTTYDRSTQTVSIQLDPPVSPGATVTIGLHPVRNPQMAGIYQFGVTAYPAGEKAYGQFLGYGRLAFNDPSEGVLF